MNSDQACKDTAFGGALLFYLDINLNYKSVVELPNLVDNIHQDTSTDYNVCMCLVSFLILAPRINRYGCGDIVFLWKRCFNYNLFVMRV